MRKLNLKFLIGLITVVLVGGTVAYLLREYQVRRNARIFLAQAEQAESDGNIDKAADYYRHYVALNPPDRTEAQFRYGRMLAKQQLSDSPSASPRGMVQAFLALEAALRQEPSRHEARRQVIEMAMHPWLRRHGDALVHLKVLIDAQGKDGELLALRARCHAATKEL